MGHPLPFVTTASDNAHGHAQAHDNPNANTQYTATAAHDASGCHPPHLDTRQSQRGPDL